MRKIFLILLLLIFSNLTAQDYILSNSQILTYEIPPSVYLEELSNIQEKRAKLGGNFMTTFYLGFGTLFVMSAPDAAPEVGGPGFGYLMGAICFVAGIWSILDLNKDTPKSLSMERYVEVSKEPDRDEREIKAYNTLVWLAKSLQNMPRNGSHNNTNTQDSYLKDLIASIFIKSAVEKTNIFSIEQRALDGFLTQMPVDIVF